MLTRDEALALLCRFRAKLRAYESSVSMDEIGAVKKRHEEMDAAAEIIIGHLTGAITTRLR